MDYVDRLKMLREDHDLSQSQVAEILKCKQSAVSKYERRVVPYSVENVVKLCEFYQVSADYVFGLPEGMPYPRYKK